MKLFTALAVASASITTVANAQTERDLDSHEHGAATLNVAIDETAVFIELETPWDNLVGFEHAPQSDDQQALVDQALSTLNQPDQLFLFAGGDCTISEVDIDSSLASKDADGHDEHSDGHGDEHSDEHSDGHDDEHSDEHSDGHDDEHSDEHSDGHDDKHSDEHSDEHDDKHSDGHSDGHDDKHSDEHSDGHDDEHSDEHSDGHGDEHSDEHSDGHGDEHSDEHSDGHGDEHSDEHSDGHGDEHSDEHDDAHGHGHDHDESESETHSAAVVTYTYSCANTASIESIDVKLFDVWSGFNDLDVQLIGPGGQALAELASGEALLDISRVQ